MDGNKKGIILIVDDSKYDRLLYREYLGHDRFEIHEVEDGDEVLDQLKIKVPDLIMLDWDMPRVGGLEVLHMLKKDPIHNTIPIIVITGRDDDEVLSTAFDFGSVDFLNKPVKKDELNARIVNILRTQDNIVSLEKEKFELEEISFNAQIEKANLKKIQALEFEDLKAASKFENVFLQDLGNIQAAIANFDSMDKEEILESSRKIVSRIELRINEYRESKKL